MKLPPFFKLDMKRLERENLAWIRRPCLFLQMLHRQREAENRQAFKEYIQDDLLK